MVRNWWWSRSGLGSGSRLIEGNELSGQGSSSLEDGFRASVDSVAVAARPWLLLLRGWLVIARDAGS